MLLDVRTCGTNEASVGVTGRSNALVTSDEQSGAATEFEESCLRVACGIGCDREWSGSVRSGFFGIGTCVSLAYTQENHSTVIMHC